MTQVVQIHRSNDPAITMSEAAISHVQSFLQKQTHGIGFRLSVKETGCSGLSYVVEMVDMSAEDDLECIIVPGVSVFVPQEHLRFLQGTKIDFISGKMVFNNPKEAGSCGCGKSFTV